jgi:thioester reductase-like protein
MVPSRVVPLPALPLTANGKVDRKALPDLESEPAGAVEEEALPPAARALAGRILEILREVMSWERVGLDDDLLALGAGSVEIIRIAVRLQRELGFQVELEKLFRNPTVRALATALAREAERAPAAGTPDGPSVLTDPDARAAFKQGRPGMRRDLEEMPLALLAPGPGPVLAERFLLRRSHRRFSAEPVRASDLAGLLESLRSIALDGGPKHLYASAGGLYPVQTYVHARPGRIEGLAGGLYYYDPDRHGLRSLALGAEVDPDIHEPFINRAIYEGAAFSLFFVGRLAAIAPIYGEHAQRFATLEAGLMSQLLDLEAPVRGLGLCHIGSLDFAAIRPLFGLEDEDVLLHSLVGGCREAEGAGTWAPAQEAYRAEPRRPRGAAGGATAAELAAEVDLEDAIPAGPLPPAVDDEPRRIFLTGATGFLGAYLLAGLLRETGAGVLCLVRAPDAAAGLARLRQALETHGLWEPGHAARIEAIPGDLELVRFGLDEERFSALAHGVDAIFHSGALVNFVYPYAALRAANVGGTREVLRLACSGRVKPLHHISTIAVFPLWLEGERSYRETDLEHGEVLYGGYSQSKWVAEKMVAVARSRGLPVTVYRPGGIAGDSRTGSSDPGSFLSRALRSYIELGAMPRLRFEVDMVPVDFVARAVLALARDPESRGRTFHLTGSDPISLERLALLVRELGYPLEEIPYLDWVERLQRASTGERRTALSPFLPLFEGGEVDAERGRTPRFEHAATLASLEKAGVIRPPIDEETLRLYLSYFQASGLLASPG